jgi:hypothetical protein
MIINHVTYEGRLMADRRPDCFDFAPQVLTEGQVDADLDDESHYIEVRPRHTDRDLALIIMECSVCGWEAVITDDEEGDDFITPPEIMEIARRHYLALPAAHKIPLSEITAYRLDRAEFEARGVLIQDWR